MCTLPRMMDISAPQPPGAQDTISALFFPVNVGVDGGQSAFFESVLGDELGEDVSPVSTVVGIPSPSVSLAPVVEEPVSAQPKGGRHKKPETGNDGAEDSRTTALYSLSMAPVPLEPLQQFNQFALTQTSSVRGTEPRQVSTAPTFGVDEKIAPPANPPQPGLDTLTKEDSAVGLKAATKAKLPSAPKVSSQETQAGNLIVQGAPLVQRTRSGEFTQKIPGDFRQELNTNATDDSELSAAHDEEEGFSSDSGQLISAEGGPNLANHNSVVNADGSTVGAVVGDQVVRQLQELALSVPQDPNPATSAALQSHVPILSQAGKTAAGSQVPTTSAAQAQLPGQHGWHLEDQKPETPNSALGESKNSASPLKSAVANAPTHMFAESHSSILTSAAGNDSLSKPDTLNSQSDSTQTSTTAVRGPDHKSGQAQQVNSPGQNAPITPAAPTAPAVMSLLANSANPETAAPASLPSISSQQSSTPVEISVAKSSSHDLSVPVPDASISVQVHAARIVQADQYAEMRLGMQSQTFGALEVHTSVSGKDVQFAISSEHGDLHGFLTQEVPMLQSSLQQHDLRLQQVRTVLNTEIQRDFSQGSGRREQRFSRPQQLLGTFDQHDVVAGLDEEDSSNGFSIRI